MGYLGYGWSNRNSRGTRTTHGRCWRVFGTCCERIAGNSHISYGKGANLPDLLGDIGETPLKQANRTRDEQGEPQGDKNGSGFCAIGAMSTSMIVAGRVYPVFSPVDAIAFVAWRPSKRSTSLVRTDCRRLRSHCRRTTCSWQRMSVIPRCRTQLLPRKESLDLFTCSAVSTANLLYPCHVIVFGMYCAVAQ